MPLIKLKKDGKDVKDKNGRIAYRVRVNFVDVNGKKRQVERMAYGLAEATLLEQQLVYCTVDIQQNSTCLYSHSMV